MTEAGLIKGHLQFQNVPKCVWQTEFCVLMASSPTVLPHLGEVVLSRQQQLPLRPECASGVPEGGRSGPWAAAADASSLWPAGAPSCLSVSFSGAGLSRC